MADSEREEAVKVMKEIKFQVKLSLYEISAIRMTSKAARIVTPPDHGRAIEDLMKRLEKVLLRKGLDKPTVDKLVGP